MDGAHEIHDIYENAAPQLFVPNILSFASEGKELFFGGVRNPLQFWSPWRVNDEENNVAKKLGLGEIEEERQKVRVRNAFSYKAQSYEECRAPARYSLDSD